ncbi:hypothetical protein AVEN_202207-1 [Araneus ventricosus]|uniref:Uncharacterized protein n=1 Tax=Araneus ventricosus TaxID=182803 RepID=A0A4Y2P7P8_ARAVE|nr:hypothetical protein AVEN_192229-1 [Araneus ventricosus]GBN47210.1 hypothetical protein AVEN_202207-1 [Araneus ventricosus]
MVFPVRHTNTKKKRMGSHKKHNMKYFCCLCDNDGKMGFQGLSDSCELVQSAELKGRGDNSSSKLTVNGLDQFLNIEDPILKNSVAFSPHKYQLLAIKMRSSVKYDDLEDVLKKSRSDVKPFLFIPSLIVPIRSDI